MMFGSTTLARADAPGDDAPGGFTLLGATDTGRTLFARKADLRSLRAAIERSADDLAKVLDAKPIVGDAFAEKGGQRRGGATFTAKFKARDVAGWILVGLDQDGGAAISVVFDRPDAKPSQLAQLFAALPAQGKVREHKFPDGSGSVDLPEGWNTKSPGNAAAIVVEGPAGQVVVINGQYLVTTPDGMIMTEYRRSVAINARMGRPAPPPPRILVAPYTEPQEAMQALVPQINEAERQAGRPWGTIDKVIEAAPAAPELGGQAALIYYAHTRHEGKAEIAMRSLFRQESTRVDATYWRLTVTGCGAPEATFDRDLPAMREIIQSRKIDPEWAARYLNLQRQELQAQTRRAQESFVRLRDARDGARRQQASNFDRFQSVMKSRQDAVHKGNQDAVEMYGGFRDVYDTRTGARQAVDYYHVDGIVEGLNARANNPEQYVQVKLRDLQP